MLSRAASFAPRVAGARSMSAGAMLYNTVFKRNVTYISYVFAGAIVLEAVYGKVTDGFWTAINHGRTFETVDWSKFKTEDEEEESE